MNVIFFIVEVHQKIKKKQSRKSYTVHKKEKRMDRAIYFGNLEEVKSMVNGYPECVHIQNQHGWTPLDDAIAQGKLEIAKYLWEKDGRPNLDMYCDGKYTPMDIVANYGSTATLKWVFAEGVLPQRVLNIKNEGNWTPLDFAIVWGKLEMAQFLFEMGGRPNIDNYYDGSYTTPVHWIARHGGTDTLKWVFVEGVLPLYVLNVKNSDGQMPLEVVRVKNTTTLLLRDLQQVCTTFLALRCAKRDRQCVLRRLPDELLDMVVDEVAVRFHLKVVW